jgi:hypothetical protein
MKSMFQRSLFVIVSVLLICFSTRAQELTPLRGLDENAAAAVRKKAMDLLVSVAGQVDSLHSAENRARINSNLGDLLWEHDEKRSRTLFNAVAEDIRLGFKQIESRDSRYKPESEPNVDPDHDPDPAYMPDPEYIHSFLIFWRLRGDTIGRIVKHDPELALQFLRATKLPPEIPVPPYMVDDTEEAVGLRLATQIAAKNPQLALKLGRQSLANGFSNDLFPLLSELRQKDKETSWIFYGEIVGKLKGTNLTRDWQAMETAINLVESFQPPEADEQVYRELIGILLTSALDSGCANAKEDEDAQLCYQVGTLLPKIEKYYGQRASSLKRWHQDDSESQPSEWQLIQEAIEKGTVDDILALRVKYPDMQDQIYAGAVAKANASGDIAKVRQVASEFPEEERRHQLLAKFAREQRLKAINADKLAVVQQELSGMRNDEERIGLIFKVANQVGGSDRQTALLLLGQAGLLIDSLKPGKKQLEGQVALSMMYCSLKSDRAFAILEPLMPKLNELVAASATLDGIETNYLRDGEWNMNGEGELGRLLTVLAQNAGYFAALDFDRSVSLASQLERPELRLMAELKIAQGVLTSQPNPAYMFTPH